MVGSLGVGNCGGQRVGWLGSRGDRHQRVWLVGV